MGKIVLVLFIVLTCWSVGPVFAADQSQAQERLEEGEVVYGSQLMSNMERHEYRQQMRALKTYEEREQFRRQHHEKMQKRAKAMGKSLPEEPPQGKDKGFNGSRGYGKKGRY